MSEIKSRKGIKGCGIYTEADLLGRCRYDVITGCWRWVGARDKHGKPSMWIPALQRTGSLGIMAAVLKTGSGPRPGTAWHSTCGNADCANPSHRKEGNRSSQMLAHTLKRDPAQRARIAKARRQKAGKLSDLDVIDIRTGGHTLAQIVARYGICIGYACEVRAGKRPLHVGGAPGSSVFSQAVQNR